MELSLSSKLTFGKYRGRSVKWVIDNDPEYIDWAVENVDGFTLDEESDNYLEDAFTETYSNFYPAEY